MSPLRDWHVNYKPGHGAASAEVIHALGPDAAEALGWIVFKDDDGRVVAMIPSDDVRSVTRCTGQDHGIRRALAKVGGRFLRTGGIPPELDNLTDPAQIEIALRSEVIAALMRERITAQGINDGAAYYVYLDPAFGNQGPDPDGHILALDFHHDERTGDQVRVTLTGYQPPDWAGTGFRPTSHILRTATRPPADDQAWPIAAGDGQ